MDFEKAFDDFILGREYDDAESTLFSIIKLAFQAGWIAAGGSLTEQSASPPVLALLKPPSKSSSRVQGDDH